MDVLFVVPPFANPNYPSLGVSLLKAIVTRDNFSAKVEYLNLRLAREIGLSLYQNIAQTFIAEALLGEWFFADVVFGEAIPDAGEYVRKILARCALPEPLLNNILKARGRRHKFVEECAQRIHEAHPRVVGFTMTYHQVVASLAISRYLKRLEDPPIIVFGGANCEGQMGLQLVKSFPWIDYVCTSEADASFPVFLGALLRNSGEASVNGFIKAGADVKFTWPEPIQDLDSLPIPDYSDFFEQLGSLQLEADFKPKLLIETARGCWWGAKQHCTFCGLNDQTMAFRAKSPARAFDEFSYLTKTYGIKGFDAVDNILDLRYINTLFPKLQESSLGLELFYETKANLRYEQLLILRKGGMTAIQPGIESLSDDVLQLMKKGCTTFQNIQLLRWSAELGISVGWNLLAGFPHEQAEVYERMAQIIPLLTHLQPPTSVDVISLDRFSPLFDRSSELGLTNVRPLPAYYYVYPLGRKDLMNFAYHFDFDYDDGRNPDDYLKEFRIEAWHWQESHLREEVSHPKLDAVYDSYGELLIEDTREIAVAHSHRYKGLAAHIYLKCDSARNLQSLVGDVGGQIVPEVIAQTLTEFLAAKLMIENKGNYLSLAVFRNRDSWNTVPDICPPQPL